MPNQTPNEKLAELIAARLAQQNLIPTYNQLEVQRKLENGIMTEPHWLNCLENERADE